MQRFLSIVKIQYEESIRGIEGTRAEEFNGPESLHVYDGDSVVARFTDRVENWSTEKQ